MEPGQPTPAILELAFWEAIMRCAKDEQPTIAITPCGEDDKGGIVFDNRIPDELWQHMAAALADLREAAFGSTTGRTLLPMVLSDEG